MKKCYARQNILCRELSYYAQSRACAWRTQKGNTKYNKACARYPSIWSLLISHGKTEPVRKNAIHGDREKAMGRPDRGQCRYIEAGMADSTHIGGSIFQNHKY